MIAPISEKNNLLIRKLEKKYIYMRKIFRKKNYGFTLLELVVAISILGIMIGGSIVRYSKVTRTAQREQNRANIVIIREAFFQYFYRNHMDGNPHFPPAPQNENNLMDENWASSAIDSTISGLRPKDLFVTREVPTNNLKILSHIRIILYMIHLRMS